MTMHQIICLFPKEVATTMAEIFFETILSNMSFQFIITSKDFFAEFTFIG